MGKITKPAPVKLFVAVLTSLPQILPDLEEVLADAFGPISERSDSFPFEDTRYYDSTMGVPIRRCFIAFAELIAPEEIAGIKIRTNLIEAAFASSRAPLERPLNLDPGYIEESKIVLASTKNFYHRVLVSRGIYAEVTMHYRDGAWRPFPWTFPDFRSGRYDTFFLELRRSYRDELRQLGEREPDTSRADDTGR